ncbi:uncharacterized protein SOCEGT47_024060 [Sorangium cellulosum]|uniref:Ku domain-containing protein n=1 Tax=Sorangium cellulosum TaxID=56 RepID=A0A4P2PYP5_SORCE|nr:hypothetical protein [Sorangium cellulosum]AUX21910.1 uncharacterized protein SOCEGT47_024060 [Sorangium cellulosum]
MREESACRAASGKAASASGSFLSLLRFAYELRGDEELDLPEVELDEKGLGERELAMAERLVAEMATSWKPEKYRDEYRDDVMRLIEEKVKSGQTTAPAESAGDEEDRRQRTGAVDLIALLKKSLGQKGRKGARDEGATDTRPKARRPEATKQKGGGSRRAA